MIVLLQERNSPGRIVDNSCTRRECSDLSAVLDVPCVKRNKSEFSSVLNAARKRINTLKFFSVLDFASGIRFAGKAGKSCEKELL